MNKIIFVFALVLSFNAFSSSSMRRCTVLPIIDEINGAIGSKIFSELESKLKSNRFCSYVSNSGLMSIFGKYRGNLSQHLKSPKVISKVAEKLKVGSVFKIDLISEINSIGISLQIFGENGTDLYLNEQTTIKDNDFDKIIDTLINWIEVYSKMIPYDGLVIGVLGDQLTIDAGKNLFIKPGNKVIVKRVKSKKTHPLLKKVVDWDTEILGESVIESVSDNQALARIYRTSSNKKIMNGDWVRIDNTVNLNDKVIKKVDEEEKEKPGVLGEVEINLFITSTSLDRNVNNSSGKMSGNIFGGQLKTEAWITRNYFAGLEFIRGFGNLKESQGQIAKDNITTNLYGYKVFGGYKYLPTGFFFGPRVDFFGGIAKTTYDSNVSLEDGFGQHSFSGLLIGLKGELPLNRMYRIYTQLETIPLASFEDKDSLYNKSSNVVFLEMELGVKYSLTQNIGFNCSLESTSKKAKFSGSYKEISYKDTLLKFGTSINF